MKVFFDTSALVKFFHEERGTESVAALITEPGNEIWLLEIAILEFTSAVFRRYRNGEIQEDNLTKALDSFEREVAEFNIEPLGSAIVTEAADLLRRYGKVHGLRTLDALHLGAYSLISESDWMFVAADTVLCSVADQLGFKTMNTLKS